MLSFNDMKKFFTIFVMAILLSQNISARVLDRTLAIVGEKAILLSEVRSLKSYFKKSPTLAGFYQLKPKNITTKNLLKVLVEEAIIRKVLEGMNASVTDEQVEQQVNSIAKQNRASRKQLIQSLKNENIPFELYKRNIRAQLEKRNIFERELRGGNEISDEEARREYNKLAKVEYELSLFSPAAAQASDLVKGLNSNKINAKKAIDTHNGVELGWVQKNSLNKNFKKYLKKPSPRTAYGPFTIDGQNQVIYVSAIRQGSNAEFEKVKNQLLQRAQMASAGQKFNKWLLQKKRDLKIIVNI